MSPSPPDDPASTFLSGFGTLPGSDHVATRPATMFDVCHVGVVLRATLFAHAVLAIGVRSQHPPSMPGCWASPSAPAS